MEIQGVPYVPYITRVAGQLSPCQEGSMTNNDDLRS